MISKINRIKGLGLVFRDFVWPANAPAFRAVNLIYGWNGCGKTTLTRLFDGLAGSAQPDLEYEVEDDAGNKVRQSEAFSPPIRVFNQDYVANNVRILDSETNTISILLGGENKELVAQIRTDERLLNGDPSEPSKPGFIFEVGQVEQKRRRREKENEVAFTDIARAIGAAIIGSGMASRNYRAPDAKRDLAGLRAPAALSDDDLQAAVLSLRQEALPDVLVVGLRPIELAGKERDYVSAAMSTYSEALNLCGTEVRSEPIERLVEHPDIASWIERGLELHAQHASSGCEYCGNALSEERAVALAHHFNEADRHLKDNLQYTIATLGLVQHGIAELSVPDAARLYQELRPEFEQAAAGFIVTKDDFIAQIQALSRALLRKAQNTMEKVRPGSVLDPERFQLALAAINKVIAVHNTKSAEFDARQKEALRAIKAHYLSTISEDVTNRSTEIETLSQEIDRRHREIHEIAERIATARAQISSAHRACDQINDGLRSFLGRAELTFEPQLGDANPHVDRAAKQEVIGYKIMRRGQPAHGLSESEKTAIAFVYFVVHLGDGQFQRSEGIVVIDDPISSLDSNSLYQAFSFLKNAVNDCGQVFVFTHNFEFLKLLLNWRSRLQRRTGYYMISNYIAGDDRHASITGMDKELREYESEYHYLFKRLKEMRDEQDGSIMRAYPVPNMARKVWDSFLMFRVPNGEGSYAKMEVLKAEGHDAQKLDAVYKFTNDQSHITGAGFDPALVPETQKVLAELFELMERAAPEHFRILDKVTN